MENAVSALKIAFGIFVFILGLTILFGLTAQAREVAGVLITEADKTTYYEYYEGGSDTIDGNGNRIVTFEDIIPALYRYSEENYAVTIIDKNGNIVTRFDLDTEAICNNWINNTERDKFNRYRFVNEVYKVFNEVNILANRIGTRDVITTYGFEDPERCRKDTSVIRDTETNEIIHAELNNTAIGVMEELFNRIYGQKNTRPLNGQQPKIRRDYYCYWIRKYGMDSTKN